MNFRRASKLINKHYQQQRLDVFPGLNLRTLLHNSLLHIHNFQPDKKRQL